MHHVLIRHVYSAEKNRELERELCRLESEITQQQADAKDAISQWVERCASVEEEMSGLATEEEYNALKLKQSRLESELSSKQGFLDEINENLQIEKDNVEILLKQKCEAEAIYRGHIEELEAAIQEHVAASEELQEQLDERDSSLAQVEEQVKLLTQELVDSRSQSEEVVTQWQGRFCTRVFYNHLMFSKLSIDNNH